MVDFKATGVHRTATRFYEVTGIEPVPRWKHSRTQMLVRPASVVVNFDDGKVRSVSVSGPRILKSGAESAVMDIADLTLYGYSSRSVMPDWLREIVEDAIAKEAATV